MIIEDDSPRNRNASNLAGLLESWREARVALQRALDEEGRRFEALLQELAHAGPDMVVPPAVTVVEEPSPSPSPRTVPSALPPGGGLEISLPEAADAPAIPPFLEERNPVAGPAIDYSSLFETNAIMLPDEEEDMFRQPPAAPDASGSAGMVLEIPAIPLPDLPPLPEQHVSPERPAAEPAPAQSRTASGNQPRPMPGSAKPAPAFFGKLDASLFVEPPARRPNPYLVEATDPRRRAERLAITLARDIAGYRAADIRSTTGEARREVLAGDIEHAREAFFETIEADQVSGAEDILSNAIESVLFADG